MTTGERSRRGPLPPPGKPWEPADEPLRRWESVIERQIREAQEAGEFDDLPYQSERLPAINDAYAGDRAAAFSILRSAGAAPPWIEADREARRLGSEREQLLARASGASPLTRRSLRDRLAAVDRAYNSAVLRLNHEAPTVHQHRRPVDLEADLAGLEESWREADARRR